MASSNRIPASAEDRHAAVRALSVRLARAALELDSAVSDLEAAQPVESDSILFATPAAHAAIAAGRLEQLLYEIETRGKLGAPPFPLTAVEFREAA